MSGRGILIASSALALLASGVLTGACSEAQGSEVQCHGINSCKGQGECAAADGSHDCGGKNSCEGKGWVTSESAEECTEQGGTVVHEEEEA